jgi:hypothetical protein
MSEAPSPQQVRAAIARIHQARRESWPKAEEFGNADIEPMKMMAWLVTWDRLRNSWMETNEGLVEKLITVESVELLNELAQSTIDEMESTAKGHLEAMAKLLDKPENGPEAPF